MSFFREEAIEARRASSLGTIRLAQAWAFDASAACALAVAAAFIVFLSCAHISRKTSAPGVLVPRAGESRVVSSQAGIVASVLVKDGDPVVKGQPLLTISTERVTARGEVSARLQHTLADRRAALQSEANLNDALARQKSASLATRLLKAETELAHARDENALVQRRVALAQASEARYRQLVRDGFVSEAQLQQKQDETLDLATRARAAERAVLTLERELETMQQERDATASQAEILRAQSQRNLAAISQEEAEFDLRAALVVTAPADGIVAASDVHVGKAVEANQALLTLLPGSTASELVAQLYTTSQGIGLVTSGDAAFLRFAAFPYQRFGLGTGRVVAVSRTPIAPQDLPVGRAPALLAATQSNEPLYRIDVALDSQSIDAYGKPQPLKPGMAVQADVVRERLALWQWVLDPLLAVRARAVL